MDFDNLFSLIDSWLLAINEPLLDNRDKAIIQGTLRGLTYQKMKAEEAALRGLTIDYISRYLAHHLWQKLTKSFHHSHLINEQEKTRKSKLLEHIERISKKDLGLEDDLKLPPPDPFLDQLLMNRYKIIGDLVSHKFSKTYLGEDLGFSTQTFCIIRQFPSQSEDIKKRFQRNATSLRLLSKHPNIPNLLADFEENDYYYLVQEFMEGQLLSQTLIDGQPWTQKAVIQFLKDILGILKFVHDNNIIHREINPDNFMIRNFDKAPVLIGFGGIKEIEKELASEQGISINLSNKHYMAPEQAIGIPKPCSDIYSVGKIALQALTGKHPRAIKVQFDTLKVCWNNYPDIDQSLSQIVDKMIAYDFKQRYRSVSEVLDALESLK
ncbi:serine/threonine-protein kinase [Crocosphaera sp. XPORK-15E]|uniref:serine/threonine-protein kinase n=1 Tax=Crocosphaera sp. XPORK-15E TaxID=3110247 RepID=UPI002B1F083E|nr:serine/threonine-protein kinase [Crocosphaera sp. XPORK-15E]MEA5532765.1 serine/threonine-protein kinase [Crocosphaera sp. XPORK-15E]